MRIIGIAIFAAGLIGATAADAATIIIFVDPMTLDRHTTILEGPGPDRLLMCMQPPGTAGCTELPIRKYRR